MVFGSRLVFIDEVGISVNSNKKYGWVPIGETLTRSHVKNTSHITIIGAITDERILGYMVLKGFINAKLFAGFIAKLIEKLTDEGSLRQHIFVFD
jgi:hypothetical protein